MKLSKAALKQRKEFNFTPCPKPKKVKKITKKKLMTMKRLEQVTWTIFSQYIRLRDSAKCGSIGRDWVKCYTCEKDVLFKEAEAGHFIPRGRKILKFDETNVHSQCCRCNRFLHGNLGYYTIALQKEYGIIYPAELIAKGSKIHRFTREELENIRKYCATKIVELL